MRSHVGRPFATNRGRCIGRRVAHRGSCPLPDAVPFFKLSALGIDTISARASPTFSRRAHSPRARTNVRVPCGTTVDWRSSNQAAQLRRSSGAPGRSSPPISKSVREKWGRRRGPIPVRPLDLLGRAVLGLVLARAPCWLQVEDPERERLRWFEFSFWEPRTSTTLADARTFGPNREHCCCAIRASTTLVQINAES